jgi:hypothetical protein
VRQSFATGETTAVVLAVATAMLAMMMKQESMMYEDN